MTERLNRLAQRRADLEHGLVDAEEALAGMKRESVSAADVVANLRQFRAIYDCLKPIEQKELMHLVLRRAEVWDNEIVLEINGNVPAVLAGTLVKSGSRFGTPNWLPGLVSQSVLRDVFQIRLRSLIGWARRQVSPDRAAVWSESLATGAAASRAAVARRSGLSRARVTQTLGPRERAAVSPS